MESNRIIIKGARIVDPGSPHNGKVRDILIEEDTIVSIRAKITAENAEVFEAKNLHVSPGWLDLRANFGDPGNEDREDIESGINAAIFGGFTAIALSPDTNPPIDSKADIEYIYKKAEGFPVSLYPYGAISKEQKGQEISEMYDMYQAGAVSFSEGKNPTTNAAVLKLALQYPRAFAPALHLLPLDADLAKGGQMHEGEKSIYLGLKGIPALAEELAIQKHLYLADYAEARVHLMGISSKEGVKLLKTGKKKNTNYTADVAVANLYFTDEDLETYDTRFKVMPPLRSDKDRNALIKGLKDGTLQAIASDHEPHTIENKKCEFEHASFGITALESFIGAVGKSLYDKISWERIIELIAINPRKILNLEMPTIEEGNWAELSFFDPDMDWIFEKKHIQSKSANSPFIGKKMKGKSLGIFNNGTMVWLANS